MTAALYYTTCPDIDTAHRLAAGLLEARLIACANFLPGLQSLYRWQGEIQQETEVMLLLKSQQVHFDAIEAHLLAHHPYDCPCLLCWPIKKGHAGFLEWIKQQTTVTVP